MPKKFFYRLFNESPAYSRPIYDPISDWVHKDPRLEKVLKVHISVQKAVHDKIMRDVYYVLAVELGDSLNFMVATSSFLFGLEPVDIYPRVSFEVRSAISDYIYFAIKEKLLANYSDQLDS